MESCRVVLWVPTVAGLLIIDTEPLSPCTAVHLLGF
jgi:hypothetical protein